MVVAAVFDRIDGSGGGKVDDGGCCGAGKTGLVQVLVVILVIVLVVYCW